MKAIMTLLLLTSTAQARECFVNPPQGVGYVSWRMVDGKKCWYAGRPGVNKNELIWVIDESKPEALPPPAQPVPEKIPLPLPKPREIMDADSPPSFKQRWNELWEGQYQPSSNVPAEEWRVWRK